MKVLLIGDGVAHTGFARMNHAYADALHAAGHEVAMLAINYHGDPHGYPYDIYPCMTAEHRHSSADLFGVTRTKEMVRKLSPDVICITQDPWNVRAYLENTGNIPVVLSVAVDGKNCRGNELNGVAHSVFWTKFGEQEAIRGGYVGPSSVIPLGVDLDTFHPVSKDEARSKLPESMRDVFIVGCVGRNQPRKRIDLTMMYFADWIKSRGIRDAFLFLHVAPTMEDAYDLYQLAEYLGIVDRLITPAAPGAAGVGVTKEQMRRTYCAMDVVLTCTQGEGWGLCHMEAMACGTPNIVPNWSALGEWTESAALRIPCSSLACTINGINVIGGIPDRLETIRALDAVYSDRGHLEVMSERGLELTKRPEFRWQSIGDRFRAVVEGVVVERAAAAAAAVPEEVAVP